MSTIVYVVRWKDECSDRNTIAGFWKREDAVKSMVDDYFAYHHWGSFAEEKLSREEMYQLASEKGVFPPSDADRVGYHYFSLDVMEVE